MNTQTGCPTADSPHIICDRSISSTGVKESRNTLDIRLHNIGVKAVNDRLDAQSISEANAAMYMHDLIIAIQSYIEEGNSSTFTIGSSRYPNAETFDWDE